MSEHSNASEENPIQPADRFRRLIRPEKDPAQPVEGETIPDESNVPGIVQENPPAPVETYPISEERHPTGSPEATGGWYQSTEESQKLGEDSQPTPVSQDDGAETPPEEPSEPRQESDIPRHPTGDPASTGGWYSAPDPAVPLDGTRPQRLKTGPQATAQPEKSGGWVTPPPDPDATRVSTSGADQPRRRRASSEVPTRPVPSLIPVDENGMPLPYRVEEVDRYATRVTPAAYGQTAYPQPGGQTVATPAPTRAVPMSKPRQSGARRSLGCLVKLLIAMLFIAVIAVVLAGSFAVYQYYSIAATLPDISDLKVRASQFETTRILDRNGSTLYEILDPNAGRRTS